MFSFRPEWARHPGPPRDRANALEAVSMAQNDQSTPPGGGPSTPAAQNGMIRKLPVTELKPGMLVVDSGLPALEYPYLYSKDVRISSERHIQALLKEGYREAFVLHEPEEEAAPFLHTDPAAPGAVSQERRQGPRIPEREEYQKAHALYRDSFSVVKAALSDVKLGKPVDREASAKLLTGVYESIAQNPDAMVTFVNMRAHDDYTFTHCINVSVLSLVFGSYLGLARNELLELAESALFHDLGMTAVPDEIIFKPGRLTPAEFDVVRTHPNKGAEILAKQGVTPDAVLTPIREHHERFNGSGYPHGLPGGDISLGGQITALGDVYDALTSKRSYRGAVLPNTTMRILFAMRGKDFEQDLVDRFIKCLGIYPVGSMVRLASGELAMVCGSNPANPLSPTVKIITDKTGKPRPHRIVDLSSHVAAQTAGMSIEGPVEQSALVDDPMGYVF
jgi:HD-GYP domain-containing protein (c-di-GMP phosphodiesterase class II)